jgi:type I restriction enzyme S subunit
MNKQTSLNDIRSVNESDDSLLQLGPTSIEIPKRWEIKKFDSACELVNGINYSSDDYSEHGQGALFLTLNSIQKGGGYKRNSEKHYEGDLEDDKLLQPGDLVLANTDVTQEGDVIGYTAKVPETDKPVTPSMDLSILRHDSTFNTTYLNYLFRIDFIHSRMRAFSAGSTVLHLNIPVPPKIEQRKIASVLYNVDRAIEKTEEIIEQTRRVKQGVMQDLLLKGVDQIGHIQELDSSPVDDRKLVQLGEIMTLEYGENLPTGDRNEGEIPVYGSNGIVDRHNEPYVEKPGLIVGRKGTIGDATFSDQPFWPIDTTYYITENQTKVKLKFLYYLLNSLQLDRLNAASAIPGLNRNDAYGLKALIPDEKTQIEIVDRLEAMDELVERKETEKEHLQRLKKGLMQDLLTGKVRTKQEDIRVMNEVKE